MSQSKTPKQNKKIILGPNDFPDLLLQFFGKYPAMDIRPLLPECHGSEIIFDWSRRFYEGRTKRNNRWFGSDILRYVRHPADIPPIGGLRREKEESGRDETRREEKNSEMTQNGPEEGFGSPQRQTIEKQKPAEHLTRDQTGRLKPIKNSDMNVWLTIV